MVVSRKRRGTKKRRRTTAGGGMHWGGFGEVTGASRESVLAEGDCADVVTALGRRVTWENLVYLCLFLPLYVSQFPFILPYPSFPLTLPCTHEQIHTDKHNTPHYAFPLQTLSQLQLSLLLYRSHASAVSQCSL